jgi:hypothetical protein
MVKYCGWCARCGVGPNGAIMRTTLRCRPSGRPIPQHPLLLRPLPNETASCNKLCNDCYFTIVKCHTLTLPRPPPTIRPVCQQPFADLLIAVEIAPQLPPPPSPPPRLLVPSSPISPSLSSALLPPLPRHSAVMQCPLMQP